MQGPAGKHLFGLVKIGDKGQIVIPKEAREVFGLKPGDKLLMLGDEAQGIALVKADTAKLFASILPVMPMADDMTDMTDGIVPQQATVTDTPAAPCAEEEPS